MLGSMSILEWGIWISALLYMVAFCLNAYRILIGPSLPDRIAALDTMYMNAIGPVILMGISTGTRFDFEAAVLIAMFGFLSIAALCKYLLRGMIIE